MKQTFLARVLLPVVAGLVVAVGANCAKSSKPSTDAASIAFPAPIKGEMIITHAGHTLSYNRTHNTPNWVAWKLTKQMTYGRLPRSDKFWADPAVPKPYRVDWFEYFSEHGHWDRGHMCPAGDMKWDEKAMHDCFYMTNMCPQNRKLNDGSWKYLEESCRRWARTEGTIYIICGPVYDKGKKHLVIGSDHKIDVPEGFFKAVLSMREGHEKATGFYYTNTPQQQSMPKAAMTIDELEKKIGMDLFPALPDDLERRIEARNSYKDWK